MSSVEDPVVPLERNLYGHPLAGLLWERQFEKILLKYGWEKFQIGNVYLSTEQEDYFYQCMWTISNWQARNKILIRCGMYSIKKLIWENRHHSLIMCTWVCTQRQCEISKDIVTNYKDMFESRISAGAKEKLPTRASGKPDETIYSCSYDMEGHAKKCVERYCEWRIKQRNIFSKSQHHAWMIINLKKKKMSQLENCLQFAHQVFWNACIWLVLGDLIFCGL